DLAVRGLAQEAASRALRTRCQVSLSRTVLRPAAAGAAAECRGQLGAGAGGAGLGSVQAVRRRVRRPSDRPGHSATQRVL
ncbi:unnamed protein product, partial [Effrenium voratum]